MGELFGTDGIRGVANRYPMTPEVALRVGRCGAQVLASRYPGGAVVVGRDTRTSGPMIESAVCSGVLSAGMDVWHCGVAPTPLVAFAARDLGVVGGIVISASHNPAEDNGIKFFSPKGSKLSEIEEAEIESMVLTGSEGPRPTGATIGNRLSRLDATPRYVKFLLSTVSPGLSLGGRPIVIDCAHGAAYQVAHLVFQGAGLEHTLIHSSPDGTNINRNCGAEHLDALCRQVQGRGAALGVALDGDADRATFVDQRGEPVSGEAILCLLARHRKVGGREAGNLLVTTVMSNLGLDRALAEVQVEVHRVPVGDRAVAERMVREGAMLGGEASGHVIFREDAPAGDGLLTALQLISVLAETGAELSELASAMTPYPQVLRNVPVHSKVPLEQLPRLQAAIQEAEQVLGNEGRILVRYSGTENLARILVEGRVASLTEELASSLATAFEPIREGSAGP